MLTPYKAHQLNTASLFDHTTFPASFLPPLHPSIIIYIVHNSLASLVGSCFDCSSAAHVITQLYSLPYDAVSHHFDVSPLETAVNDTTPTATRRALSQQIVSFSDQTV